MPSYLTSADGTKIAFDQIGNGPPVVIVSGMCCSRRRTQALAEQLARRLAGHLSVVNHDRRGRGDSGDTTPYEIQRELDDLAALVAATGGEAAVYGHSSGAGLAVHAAAHGLPITRLVLHEPPYGPTTPTASAPRATWPSRFASRSPISAPPTRSPPSSPSPGHRPPSSRRCAATPTSSPSPRPCPTTTRSWATTDRGGIVPVELIEAIDVPTLVISGGTSREFFRHTATRIGTLLPNSTHTVLDGHDHGAPADVVAPVVADYVRA